MDLLQKKWGTIVEASALRLLPLDQQLSDATYNSSSKRRKNCKSFCYHAQHVGLALWLSIETHHQLTHGLRSN